MHRLVSIVIDNLNEYSDLGYTGMEFSYKPLMTDKEIKILFRDLEKKNIECHMSLSGLLRFPNYDEDTLKFTLDAFYENNAQDLENALQAAVDANSFRLSPHSPLRFSDSRFASDKRPAITGDENYTPKKQKLD